MTAPLARLQTLLDIATGVTTNKDEARNAAFAACRLLMEQKVAVVLFVEEGKLKVGASSGGSEPSEVAYAWRARAGTSRGGSCSCGPTLEALGVHAPGCPRAPKPYGDGPDDLEVVFVAVQGPLVGGGRDVHLVSDLPAAWPAEPARGLCGKSVKASRGGSYMRITRRNAHSFKNDLFHSWPTSLLCAQCASVQMDRDG